MREWRCTQLELSIKVHSCRRRSDDECLLVSCPFFEMMRHFDGMVDMVCKLPENVAVGRRNLPGRRVLLDVEDTGDRKVIRCKLCMKKGKLFKLDENGKKIKEDVKP